VFKKAVNGDGESFYKLLQPIKDILYKVAFTYVENEEDALDCVHEAIIKAIKSLKKLNEPQYFNTWMTRITINTCKDYIKKNRKVSLVDINDYENVLYENEVENDHMEDITMALKKLKEDEKELIVMRYLEDMSLKDISEKSNVPLGTIKSKISRTLKKLRVYMEEA
jgi:RNA polymerase sigma-70 factor (ECF subfamily)